MTVPAPGMRVVVDGTNVLYRSFYALSSSGLSHAGRPVWAVHGLLVTLARFIREYHPSHVLVAFDSPGGCPARRSLQPSYKLTRVPPADDLAYQLQWAPMLLAQAGFGAWAYPGWEADDGLASAAAAASPAQVLVVSSDRDVFQLISERVLVSAPGGELIPDALVQSKWGVPAAMYPHLAALRGEPSDNLAGVTGIGAKTAARLVAEFGTLDEILRCSDEQLRKVLGPKALAALRAESGTALLSLQVGSLRTDLPVQWESGCLVELVPSEVERVVQSAGLPRAAAALASALAEL